MQASKKRENIPNPRATASPISLICFGWMFEIFRKGFKKDLEMEDLYEALEEHKSGLLGDKMERLWKKEIEHSNNNKKSPNLIKIIIKCFGLQIMGNCLIVIINDLLFRMTRPFFLGGLIRYFTPGSNMDISMGYIYAAGIIVSSALNILVWQSCVLFMMHIGMKIRIGLCSLLYRKALKLSKTAIGLSTIGQMVNLVANDMSHFDRSLMFFVYLWFAPIQTIIIGYFVWLEIGVAALIGIASILLTIPIQAYLGRMLSIFRIRIAKRTDERIRLMNEVISGIQVIKMYAWEKQFANLINIARKHEIKTVRMKSYIHGLLYSLETFITRIAVFVGMVAYALLGDSITAEKMFVVTAYYQILKLTMTNFFPESIIYGSAGLASVQRIKMFLLYEEITHSDEVSGKTASKLNDKVKSYETQHCMNIEENEHMQLKNSSAESDIEERKTGITFYNVTAKWNEELTENTLTDLRLDVKPAGFVAIIGQVGAGKTSLFHAILKELPLISGSISVGGTISYASQEPWLFTGSVRQNILFGQPMVRQRYRKVVKVCALEQDYELFPHGDRTIVGDRGTTLSGGQRARINLARAVYREADIYLLDDPLSAVDTHVGRHLFEHCICDFLKDKTRILATHQLQYLQTADNIVVLEKGAVIGMGTFAELQNSNLDFAKQLHSENVDLDKVDGSNSSSKQILQRNSSVISWQSSVAGTEISQVAEMCSHGNVSLNVYRDYCAAGGNWYIILLVFCVFVLSQVAISGGDYWMSYWTKVEEQHRYSRSEGNNLNRTYVALTTWLPDTETCIFVYTGILVAIIIFSFGSNMSFFRLCMKSSVKLHDTMFNSITRATMWFFNNIPAGQILNRFSKDIGDVDEILPGILLVCAQQILAVLGVFAVVAIVNAWLLIPTAFVFIVFYMLRVFYVRTSRSMKRLEGIARSPVLSHLNASLQGLTTIRAFGAQSLLQKEFDNYQDVHSSSCYLAASSNRGFGLWLDLTCVGYITLLILTFLLFSGEQFAGDVGLAITQTLGMIGMVQWGVRMSADAENLMTSVERVQEFNKVDKESPLKSTLDKKPPKEWPSFGEIMFDKVFLRYSVNEQPILKNICITINSAEKVGIVGRTGAGKSSLLTALFRLVELSNGSIKIDGIDIGVIGLHDLRSKISIIPQEPALFSGSLRENLDPFNQYSDAVLWSALEEVELKQAVEEMPAGLSHKVSEGGSNFSVGQRQLLCLARAIIRNNKILVMDEATANVDPQTDELIQATIRDKFFNCTVLTVAHRLHTVMDNDRIIVMDAGKVVEFNHPHLLLKNKTSILYSMVQQTGPAMEEILCKIAQIGWNDVSFHGSDQIPTPNIDALAYSGVILNRHYTLPTCTPSRSAFMTGKYPIRTGMQGIPIKCGEPRGLPLEETLLPQRLQDLGYITRLVGKWHLGYHHSEYTPTKRGFHSHFGYWNGYIGYFDYKIDQGEFIGYDLHRDLNVSWAENGKYATDVFTQEAVHLISSHNESKPLFLQVAHLAVHSGRDSQLLEVPNPDEAHEKFKYIQDPQRRLYAEMTTRLDDSVGKIVTALKDKGILNNTVIIFLSDNGAQTIGLHQNWGSNWPLRGLKFTLYEGGVRGVAALWSSTLKTPHKIYSHLMHIVDWYPTIYSMTGGDISKLGKIDGINQWSYLMEDSNSTGPRKDAVINIGEEDNIEGIIDGKWKLIQSTYKNGSYDSYFGEDGRGLQNSSYNVKMVLASPVFKALQSVQNSTIKNENHMIDQIKQLRKGATISCPRIERQHSEGSYCPTYCLFDIEDDPCEGKNVISSHSVIAEYLKNKLKTFKNQMVPELNKPVSGAANPQLHNNTWVSWLDEEYINQTKLYKAGFSRSEGNMLKPYIFFFLFIIIFIYL